MIIFYPKELDMWGEEFDFHPTITLVPKAKTNHRAFHGPGELFDFLKDRGVVFTDLGHPFTTTDIDHPTLGWCREVRQGFVLGWIVDDFR